MELTISQDCAQDIRHVFSVEKRLSLAAKGLLILLRVNTNQVLTCPQPLLSRLLSMGLKELRSAILELEQHGLIEVTANRNSWGSHSASTYRLSQGKRKSPLSEAKG